MRLTRRGLIIGVAAGVAGTAAFWRLGDRIASLNPNSQFHLSLELNYPNAFDREVAARDGRTNLGGKYSFTAALLPSAASPWAIP